MPDLWEIGAPLCQRCYEEADEVEKWNHRVKKSDCTSSMVTVETYSCYFTSMHVPCLLLRLGNLVFATLSLILVQFYCYFLQVLCHNNLIPCLANFVTFQVFHAGPSLMQHTSHFF